MAFKQRIYPPNRLIFGASRSDYILLMKPQIPTGKVHAPFPELKKRFWSIKSWSRGCVILWYGAQAKKVSSMKHLFSEITWDEILNYPSEWFIDETLWPGSKHINSWSKSSFWYHKKSSIDGTFWFQPIPDENLTQKIWIFYFWKILFEPLGIGSQIIIRKVSLSDTFFRPSLDHGFCPSKKGFLSRFSPYSCLCLHQKWPR